MAKRLPSPEEYGRKLAERKRKADRIPQVLAKLDTLAVGLAEQTEFLSGLTLEDLQKTVEALNDRIAEIEKPPDMTDAFRVLQDLQEAVLEGVKRLSESLESQPEFPTPETVDLEPLMKEIRGYRSDRPSVTPEVKASVLTAYEFEIVRDANNDIATGTRLVPVMKH